MRLNAGSVRLLNPWRVLMCLFVLTALPSLAQDAPEPTPVEQPQPVEPAQEPAEDLGPMTLEIDLERLLFDTQGSNLQDPVWRLTPRPGKSILLVPFTVDNIHRTNKLSRFPISVRTGRLIGFVIPKPDATNRSTDAMDLSRIIRAAPGELHEMLFAPADDEAAEQPTNNSPTEDEAKPTPDNAPRLAREITLHADGTVRWQMDRSFNGGEAQSASEQNLYGYKIDPEALRAAQPEKAERLTRNEGEDSRAFALRKRESQVAEREKMTVYRELRDSLRNLPESFSEPLPSVLYAAMEVPADNVLSFQGPAPLPWALDDDKKKFFDQLARGGNLFQDGENKDLAGKAVTMIQGHPLDARAIAIATMRSKLAGQVKADDPGYEIITRLLQSNDQATRRIALYSVATVTPPTLASAKLIGVAGEASLGEERKMLSFASLSKLFSTQADNPENASTLIERVSQAITDPQGPSAPRIIEKVLDSLAPFANSGRQQLDSATSDVMVKEIDLSGVTPEESVGVIAAIIERSPTNPVAAGWLDQQLLGSADKEIVNQTLSQLYESKIEVTAPDAVAYDGTAEARPEPKPVLDADTLVLSGTIPMNRQDHALLGFFDSNDDLQQAAAWAVLGRFHLALPAPEHVATPQPTEGEPVDPTLAMFDAILAKAKQREKMPASVVAFIVNQTDTALTKVANERFVELLATPDLQEKTASAALTAYVAEPERYNEVIAAMESKSKWALMESMYRSQGQEPPLMAGMIADTGATLKWLTTYVHDQVRLPTVDDWSERAVAMGESGFLTAAASEDTTLSVAASAALVMSAGGDEQQEQAFAQTVALMEARTAEEVKKQWEEQRRKIFADAYKRAQGTYLLVVSLRDAVVAGSDDDAEPAVKRIDIGLVELRAEGVELSLSIEAVTLSPVDGRLGIRIDKPASLRSFDKPELSKIAPEHFGQSIDLLPQLGGVWSGETSLPDGKTLIVSLEPAN